MWAQFPGLNGLNFNFHAYNGLLQISKEKHLNNNIHISRPPDLNKHFPLSLPLFFKYWIKKVFNYIYEAMAYNCG